MVYIFYYNPCIWESASQAVSLHYSIKGAFNAMREHKLDKYNEWLSYNRHFRTSVIFGKHEDWYIGKKEILP